MDYSEEMCRKVLYNGLKHSVINMLLEDRSDDEAISELLDFTREFSEEMSLFPDLAWVITHLQEQIDLRDANDPSYEGTGDIIDPILKRF